MRWWASVLLPFGLLLTAAALAAAAQTRLGASASRSRFWWRVSLESGLLLGLLSLLSGWLESLAPKLWHRGLHAHFDLVPTGLGVGTSYAAALFLPLGLWAVLLGVSAELSRRRPPAPAAAPSAVERFWPLLAALPLALALVLAWPRLGGGPAAYPAFTWSTLVLVLVSLLGFALAQDTQVAATSAARVSLPATASPEPWPRALRERGIGLTTLARWPAQERPREADTFPVGELGDQLRLAGLHRVPAELVRATERLLAATTATGPHGRALLVFGAADDGGLEVVAAAAALAERRRLRTLVIAPDNATGLAAELESLLPETLLPLAVLEQPGDLDLGRPIWVASAEAAAESILPRLGRGELTGSLGLVVWWNLHRATGVPAANLWALSHRLYRLLAHLGTAETKTLAFAWRARHPIAQVERFARRLLPHSDTFRDEISLRPSWFGPTELHLVRDVKRFFELSPRLVAGRLPPLAAAAYASREAGWPTHLSGQLDRAALAAAGQPQGPADLLAPRAAEATALLLTLEAGETLALPERVSELGRAQGSTGERHAGIVLGPNPYLDYLLGTLPEQPAAWPRTSRRLVAAVGQPRVLKGHLLKALAELPGSGESLRRDFLAHEGALEETLGRLLDQGELERQEMRFLSPQGRLRRDFRYRSLKPAGGQAIPFDSAGGTLLELRDPTAAHHERGVLLRVDTDRLPIKAYPHRVFSHQGRRYRVREWPSIAEAELKGAVDCELEARALSSLRLRRHALQRVQPVGDRVSLGQPGLGLSRQRATLRYDEWVDGALHLERDLHGGWNAQTVLLDRTISFSLATTGLLLLFPENTRRAELVAVAGALRALLPVHLGVEEDDVEVVALGGDAEDLAGRPCGIALVEMFAGGFGLLEPIADDLDLLLGLLVAARDWLRSCPCGRDQGGGTPGCAKCLRGLPGQAVASGSEAGRAAALSALSRVLGA